MLHINDLCAGIYIHVRIILCGNFAFTYDDPFQQYGCINSIELRNSSASVIYIAIAGMLESTRY